MNITGEPVLIMGFVVQSRVDGNFQFRCAVRTKLGQVVLFRVGPQGFDRIEFRGVGREVFNVQVRRTSQIGLQKCGAMALQTIPQQDDRPTEMSPQLLEHGDDHRVVDRVMRP